MTSRNPTLRAAILCGLVFAALCVYAGPKEKEPAPRFTAKTTDGEKFTNDTIKGKVVLLEFWTTWCPYCYNEAPFVDKITHEYSDKGLIVLSVNVGESKKTVKKYLDRFPRATRVVLTDDTNLAAMYQATVYPIYVAIDRDGNIAGTDYGAGGERRLRALLATAGIGSENVSDLKEHSLK